jgi:hypothetical protein
MVKSASTFIESKGAATVADATGRTVGAVRVWKHRDRFPREAWLELSQAFPELTLEVLKEIEPAKTERAA